MLQSSQAHLHDGGDLRRHHAEHVGWQAVAVVHARPRTGLRRAAEDAADRADVHAGAAVAHHDIPRERLAKVLARRGVAGRGRAVLQWQSTRWSLNQALVQGCS